MTTPTAPLLTEKEAATVLKLSPKTLALWRYQSTGPAYVRLGGSIRYRPEDLAAWVAGNVTDPTA